MAGKKTQDDKVVAEETLGTEMGTEAGETCDELAVLQEELEKAKAQAAEYLDGWQRSQAEFANYRKRQESERAQMMGLVNVAVLSKLLPVLDDFERALRTLPDDLKQLTWCEGVFLIKHRLDAILGSEGVVPIDTEGKMFDPFYHEAVTYEEVAGCEDGQIIGEAQRGYMVGERVLRPALVRVARAPLAPPEEAGGITENDKE